MHNLRIIDRSLTSEAGSSAVVKAMAGRPDPALQKRRIDPKSHSVFSVVKIGIHTVLSSASFCLPLLQRRRDAEGFNSSLYVDEVTREDLFF